MSTDLPLPTVRPTVAPRVGALAEHAPQPMRVVLNWGRRYSLWVFNFGLACCAIEFIAASMARHDFIRLGVIPFAPGPRQADLMVVSGTVTDKMAPAIRRLYDQMPEPKYVISFGACSNSGGPYWDSYCVMKGVDTIIPVDVYVPGCPPRPEALLQGIVKLQEKIAAERITSKGLARRYAGGRLASAAEVQRGPVTPDQAGRLPGRGDALTARPGTVAPPAESAPSGGAPGTMPPQELASGQGAPSEGEAASATTASLPLTSPPTGRPPDRPTDRRTDRPASPPTERLPVSDPPTRPLPVVPPPAAPRRRLLRRRPAQGDPSRTLADDLFDLGADTHEPDEPDEPLTPERPRSGPRKPAGPARPGEPGKPRKPGEPDGRGQAGRHRGSP